MNNLLRAGVASAAAALLALSVVSEASAATYSVAAKKNGVTKGVATWDNGIDELCADLKAGYRAVASINGNSVTDFSDNGTPNCVYINNVNNGSTYTLRIDWMGTGGATAGNQTAVIG